MKKTSPVSAQCLSALLLVTARCKNETTKIEVHFPVSSASEVKATPTAEGSVVTFLFPPSGVGDIRIYRQEENAKGAFRLPLYVSQQPSTGRYYFTDTSPEITAGKRYKYLAVTSSQTDSAIASSEYAVAVTSTY